MQEEIRALNTHCTFFMKKTGGNLPLSEISLNQILFHTESSSLLLN